MNPTTTQPFSVVARNGNTNRAFHPKPARCLYGLWKRQMAVYAAAARRQAQTRSAS